MVTPAEEEQLREFYYICCRNEGCTINEASERSLQYVIQIYNAKMSLTTTAYLEEVFQKGVQPTTDLYTVLGVTRNATAAEIRKAHRALSLRWHPDRRTEQEQKEATEKMAEINQANDILSNELKRRFYDRWGVLPSED
ncbi:unnamed protein product [Alternaria alternata]